MRFPRQEYWSGFPFPSPGDLPDPGIEPAAPALAGGFFTPEPTGKPTLNINNVDSECLLKVYFERIAFQYCAKGLQTETIYRKNCLRDDIYPLFHTLKPLLDLVKSKDVLCPG